MKREFKVGDRVKHFLSNDVGVVFRIVDGIVKARFLDGTQAWSDLEGFPVSVQNGKEKFVVLRHLTPLEEVML